MGAPAASGSLIWPKAKNNTDGAITVRGEGRLHPARQDALCLHLAGEDQAEDDAGAVEEDGGDDGYVAEEPED